LDQRSWFGEAIVDHAPVDNPRKWNRFLEKMMQNQKLRAPIQFNQIEKRVSDEKVPRTNLESASKAQQQKTPQAQAIRGSFVVNLVAGTRFELMTFRL